MVKGGKGKGGKRRGGEGRGEEGRTAPGGGEERQRVLCVGGGGGCAYQCLAPPMAVDPSHTFPHSPPRRATTRLRKACTERQYSCTL